MTNKETKNVHNEEYLAERQEKLEAKAKGLVAYMDEDPKARLIPNLRVTETGIMPDVRLVLLDNVPVNESDTSTGSEGDGEGEATDSGEESVATESTESQAS